MRWSKSILVTGRTMEVLRKRKRLKRPAACWDARAELLSRRDEMRYRLKKEACNAVHGGKARLQSTGPPPLILNAKLLKLMLLSIRFSPIIVKRFDGKETKSAQGKNVKQRSVSAT